MSRPYARDRRLQQKLQRSSPAVMPETGVAVGQLPRRSTSMTRPSFRIDKVVRVEFDRLKRSPRDRDLGPVHRGLAKTQPHLAHRHGEAVNEVDAAIDHQC